MQPANSSLAESLALLPEAERKLAIDELTDAQAHGLLTDWRFWARPKQLPPPGDWDTWVLDAGRGFGKTRAGAGWMQERAYEFKGRWMALIGRTIADVRDYQIEGPGGLLRNAPPDRRPEYIAGKRRVTWPNGSWATIYTDEEPEALRGFSGDTAWLDEFAKYRNPEDVWENLDFGMREASTDQPRRVITTTPRPLAILKQIIADKRTVTVIGSSYENRTNLDPKWFAETLKKYEGTRIGRQEIYAEILGDYPGALWSRRSLDENRVRAAPGLVRVVVSVDPNISSGEDANEHGIIVSGRATDNQAYVLDDFSARGSPDQWARKSVAAYKQYAADVIVAEANQGGEMVRSVIHSVDATVPVKLVHASRGKFIRAEPIASLYEQGRVHHVGVLGQLEDQMIEFTPDRAADRSDGYSPDRVDALVWGITELFPGIIARDKPAVPVLPGFSSFDESMGTLG